MTNHNPNLIDITNPPAYLRDDWSERRVDIMLGRTPRQPVEVFTKRDVVYIAALSALCAAVVVAVGLSWWFL